MALAYLLSPTFEFVNTAGKPLTGGYLEVYIAGSREKYYCASDFSGTLHPFRIPLDSLGANVVLAEEGNSYDVYVYNRYGGLVMSRYNVKPGEGGGISGDSITSTDGSIIVTQTGDGVDLRVNAKPPTVMRCTASDLTGDGAFQFSELQRDGTSARVDSYAVKIDEGWWHYDATVRLRWTGEANATQSISLYSINSSDSLTFDLSYPHAETVRVSGEHKATQNGTAFVLGILGVPVGMTVSMVDFGIHSIVGEGGAGGKYNGGTGIVIDETNRVISIDPEVVQEKLTAGSNITIDSNNVISAVVPEYANADWDATSGEPGYIYHKPDLSIYATTQDVETALADKQDVLTAGSNIQLNGSTISATDTTYTAGNGLELSGTEFSVDTTEIQEKLTAGSNIVIEGNTISATAEPQLQANWAETSTDSVQYIQNKPDLSVYATTSAMNTALAGKQDVISDLSDIRAGAQAGSTAVQPATLNDYVTNSSLATTLADYVTDTELSTILEGYATTTALSTALAGKQDVISDLSDIRAGAALGATAVQPGTLDNYQEKLTAGSNVQISAQNVISATDTTYSAGSGLDLTGTTFSVDTTTIATKAELADYVTDTELGTILDGYATTTALSNGLSGKQDTLSAGNGISISSNTVSAKVDGSTITTNASGELVATGGTVPTMKELVAGNNISMVENTNGVTISATGIPTIGTVTV